MLNSTLIADALVAGLRNIPGVVARMAGDPERITRHHYRFGEENSLQVVMHKMIVPSILVVGRGVIGGNFDGQTIAKHRFQIYARTANVENPLMQDDSFDGLWSEMVNGVVDGQDQNIRSYCLLPEVDIMDTPSWSPQVDLQGQDVMVCEIVIPEIGDN